MTARVLLVAALLGLAAPGGATEAPLAASATAALAAVEPRPRPDPAAGPPGAGELCAMMERAAAASGLDPGFFARLIWRESLFDPAAVSPKGAQGIAQFIPATAARRGLADPFDPAAALDASAAYLADLTRAYGSLGLAAVAYNGGEARAERFLARAGGLPLETRAYVLAITGHSAETWRDAPPAALDLALGGGDFRSGCVALAATRGRGAEPDAPALSPWGVVLVSARDRGAAERQVARLRNRHAGVLGAEAVVVARMRLPSLPRAMHAAQVGRPSRAEADALCARLRADGGDCMVLRN
jgi:hypothetical protein